MVWKLNELLPWLSMSGRNFSCMCLAAFARELTLNSISEKHKKITRFPWNNDTSSARKSISLSTDLELLVKDVSSAFLPPLLSSRFLQMCAVFEMKPAAVCACPWGWFLAICPTTSFHPGELESPGTAPSCLEHWAGRCQSLAWGHGWPGVGRRWKERVRDRLWQKVKGAGLLMRLTLLILFSKLLRILILRRIAVSFHL